MHFIQEEQDEWTPVMSKSAKNKSYAEAVKGSSHLTGANRIPLGFLKHHSKYHSIFNRIQWPHDRRSNHMFIKDDLGDLQLPLDFLRDQ
jgi:hypothetical protein